MEDQSFRLVVYKSPHPDSILLQQLGGIKVKYGEQPDHFERYALSKPLEVPQTFWVGIQQTNALPIGVGFDQNYDNSDKTYWDSLGFWVNTDLKGTLMIRPEMYNTASLPASNEPLLSFQPQARIAPNPVVDRKVKVMLDTNNPGSNYQAKMIDVTGREVFHISYSRINTPELDFELPGHIQPGIYFWIHEIQMNQGRKNIISEKILVN